MRLPHVVEFFIPAALRADPVLTRHARLVVAVCLVGAVLLPPFALRHFVVTHNPVAGLFTLSLGLVGLALPFALRAGAPLTVLVQTLAAIICGGTFAISVSRGGFIIAPIVSILFIPLVLGLLRMRRSAAFWGVVVIVHYVTLASITQLGLFGLRPATAFDSPQMIGFAVFMTIITLIYDANRESLERQNADLQRHVTQTQRHEAIGQLAAGVAHDFNNLLTVVRASADAMLEELPANHPLHPEVLAVSEAADRGAQITRQLVQFAKAKPSAEATEATAYDVAETMGQMLPILQRLATRRIAFNYEAPAARCVVKGDPRQIEHVVLNLVANARDAMPSGGTISIRVQRRDFASDARLAGGSYIVISVRDTGTGISEAALPHIFEPFFTTKTRGTGTGLGLSTAYASVLSMGGDIRVETSPTGTLFEVVLPRADAPASVRPPAEQAAGPRPSVPPLASVRPSRGTVLVVDDQPPLVKATSRLLEHEGFTVLEADGAARALDILAERGGEIDVLLTDVVMPEMGGHALAARARALYPEVPVVYMSGYTEDSGVTREVDEGRARFVRKPFDRASLIAQIDDALA